MKALWLALALMLPLAAAAEVPDNAVWIDVRSQQEFDSGHLEGAKHIPWDGIEKGVEALQLEKDQAIYLYCGSGGRAGKAEERLKALGYSAVVNAGGLGDARALLGEK